MMETEEIVAEVREWAIGKVEEYQGKGIERIYDQMAIMEEFDEWFDPKEDLEVVSLDTGGPAYYNSNILSRYFRKDYYGGD